MLDILDALLHSLAMQRKWAAMTEVQTKEVAQTGPAWMKELVPTKGILQIELGQMTEIP
jgi:hypothetical protein